MGGDKVAYNIEELCDGGQYHANMTHWEYYCYIQNIVRRFILIYIENNVTRISKWAQKSFWTAIHAARLKQNVGEFVVWIFIQSIRFSS